MFKKIIVCAAILGLIALSTGCACNGTPAATPTPTLSPATTPTAQIIAPTDDGAMQGGMTSPDAAASPGTDASPDAAGGGGTTGGNGSSTGIPDFAEGKQVQEGDVPQIASAAKAKYENAAISSIRHTTHNGEQVYAVMLKSGTVEQTVYVRPDGTVIE